MYGRSLFASGPGCRWKRFFFYFSIIWPVCSNLQDFPLQDKKEGHRGARGTRPWGLQMMAPDVDIGRMVSVFYGCPCAKAFGTFTALSRRRFRLRLPSL